MQPKRTMLKNSKYKLGSREETMKKGERAGNTRNGRREILNPPVAPGNIIVGEYDLLQTLNNMIKLQRYKVLTRHT